MQNQEPQVPVDAALNPVGSMLPAFTCDGTSSFDDSMTTFVPPLHRSESSGVTPPVDLLA